jgi:hypothetical protein
MWRCEMDREEFTDYEGMDPGLKESIYDGAEYELDEFGERIGAEDTAEEGMSDDELMAEEEMTPITPSETAIEDGFGEAISPESNPHLEEQLDDSDLHDEAEAANPTPDKPV